MSATANEFDVIVVGVGAMGASTCWHLARRGVRVLGLDAFDIPNTRGSSHGFSRMIRMSYYEHPDYVPLLRRAYELWAELERTSVQKVLHLTGGLYMDRPGGEVVRGAREAAERHGLAHEMLDRAALRDRFPQFELPDDFVGMLEPAAGFLEPEKAIAAFVDDALRTGYAEIHAHEPVLDWRADDDGGGVTVRTVRGEYRADRLVFCGGPWTDRLVRDLGVPLVVTRQVLGWVWPIEPALFELGRLPVWALGRDDGSLYYGFPILPDGGSVGFKIALHARGTPTDPDLIAREILPGD